jgi:hypothetical protein
VIHYGAAGRLFDRWRAAGGRRQVLRGGREAVGRVAPATARVPGHSERDLSHATGPLSYPFGPWAGRETRKTVAPGTESTSIRPRC